MCQSDNCKNKVYSEKTGLCRKHHMENKKSNGQYTEMKSETKDKATSDEASDDTKGAVKAEDPVDSDIVALMETWRDRVKPSESKVGARNVLIFTKQPVDDVKKAFQDVREIKKIGMDIENDVNVVKLYLLNAIDRLTLSKIGFSHVILHKGFKKASSIIDMDNDDRITRYYKKVCES